MWVAPCPQRKPSMTHDRSWTTAGISNTAYAALSKGLPASEVWSLLLDVLARRAARRIPATLLRQWERDGSTHRASFDQRAVAELDEQLLAAAEAFKALELSPL